VNIYKASLLLLAATLLSPWQSAVAESYAIRLYDPSNPAVLLNQPTAQFVSGAANFNIDRTPGGPLASQGNCVKNVGVVNVTGLTVKLGPTLTPVTFSGNLSAYKCRTQSKKPVNYATPDGKACLDNGVNMGWITGILVNGNYRLEFVEGVSSLLSANGCAAGNDEPIFLRTYTIKNGRTLLLTGRFANPDAIHALPEPSSWMLLLAGVPALLWFATRRTRRNRVSA
jgi:hypothetical protein